MAALDNVDELISAHRLVIGNSRGAPPISGGSRLGTSLLRASTILISAAIQAEVEETFKLAIPKVFTHFSQNQCDEYWEECKRGWGNPNPRNIKILFFRIGLADPLNGLSWQNCNNQMITNNLDSINQIRNRIAHGNQLTINGNSFSLRRKTVTGWQSFSRAFISRFRPFILNQL